MAYLLIWYNPNTDNYYFKATTHYVNSLRPIGFTNQFGHELVQVMVYDFRDGHLKNWSSNLFRNDVKVPIKRRLINALIDWLEERR